MEYKAKILDGVKLNGFTYDDITVWNGYTDFKLKDIDTRSYLTKNISLKVPILSAPMDTVTESEMAIGMAKKGGMGIIHYNFENLEDMIKEVEKVKRYESGFIDEPITLSPKDKIDEAAKIAKERGISTIPITIYGKPNGRLVGMLTKNDYSMLKHAGRKIEERMIYLKDLPTVRLSDLPEGEEERLSYANNVLLESHWPALSILDNAGRLKYIVTRSDIEKHGTFPSATKDSKERLSVGLAVGPKDDYKPVIKEAVRKGVDVLLIDTAHGNAKHVVDFVEYIKGNYNVDVIAGSVATYDGAKRLAEAGADAIRVNSGSGSTCTSGIGTGIYVPQGTAVYNCRRAVDEFEKVSKKKGPKIIADGGLKETGDFVKAIACGGHTVMTGSMLAGCTEAPGWKKDTKSGLYKKIYRGMGSESAMKIRGNVRYASSILPEGIEGEVEPVGSVTEIIDFYDEALIKGMHKAGARKIEDLWTVEIGPSNIQEIHPYEIKKQKS
jgi:IMP dehydrogenase